MNRLHTRIGIAGTGALATCLFTASLLAAPLLAQPSTGSRAQEAAPEKAQEEMETPKVTGTVKFDGEIPEAKPLSIPKGAAAPCCPPGEHVDSENRALLISKSGGIKNVVVTVKVEGAKVEVPGEPFVMDQKGCRFLPHVLVVPKGATVSFLNSDETSHNVHLIAFANEASNKTVTAGQSTEQKFTEAEPVKVTCDMHTWMHAWIYVTDATHWALTDADGNFSLEGLPPGEHEIKFWHETLKSQTQKVVVGEDGKLAAPLEVKFAPKKTKKKRRRRR